MQEEYIIQRKELAKALSNIVGELIKKSKKSPTTFADEMGISKTTILNIINETGDPQLSTFCRIAEALSIKPFKLLEMIEKKLPATWSFLDDK